MSVPEQPAGSSATEAPAPIPAETSGGGAPPRRGWTYRSSGSPGRIALLWTIAVALAIVNTVALPSDHSRLVSSTLYLSGISIFAGLVAGWVLGLGQATLTLVSALITLRVAASVVATVLRLGRPPSDEYVGWAFDGLYLLATAWIIYFGYRALRSRARRVAAALAAIGVTLGGVALGNLDYAFWQVSSEIGPLLARANSSEQADDQAPDIDDDVLWGAQPSLVEKEQAALLPRVVGRTNVYAMAIAGSGSQALFSREAHEALRVAGLHFGDASRGDALLSNGAVDLLRRPLATRANIAAVAQAIGAKVDHKQDLLFVYLVSHGSRTAELLSDLPSDRSVQPISAASTATALQKAGIARRVIVVSACFSATWIPALADDNTIVITAAAKDRTSFGCDDTRRFTVFGEAFLGSLASRNVSLHDAFEAAKQKISAEERQDNVTPSLPQVFVGRNMEALWLGQDR